MSNTSVLHLNRLTATPPTSPIHFSPLMKLEKVTGVSISLLAHEKTGEALVFQMDHGGLGAPLPPFAFRPPLTETSGHATICMTVTDSRVQAGLEAVQEWVREELIKNADKIFTGRAKPAAELRANFKPLLTPGQEKKDGSLWPPILKLKLETKYEEPSDSDDLKTKARKMRFPIRDEANMPVDPADLTGRFCKRLIFKLKFVYVAGSSKTYGVTMNVQRMTVTATRAVDGYEYLDDPQEESPDIDVPRENSPGNHPPREGHDQIGHQRTRVSAGEHTHEDEDGARSSKKQRTE